MIVRPWEPGDTERLTVQQSQAWLSGSQNDVDLTPLSENKLAWTGEADGEVIGIAGFMPQWENRAIAWALLSNDATRHFVQLHREVEKRLIRAPFRRIEATVDVGFEPGHRWARMLGFEMEGYLRAFRPDGGDQIMYARVRR